MNEPTRKELISVIAVTILLKMSEICANTQECIQEQHHISARIVANNSNSTCRKRDIPAQNK